jgi:hypothetical protein
MRIVWGLACLLLFCASAGAIDDIAVHSGCNGLAPKVMPGPASKDGESGEDPNLWLPKLEPVIKAPGRAGGPCPG